MADQWARNERGEGVDGEKAGDEALSVGGIYSGPGFEHVREDWDDEAVEIEVCDFL